MIIQEMHQSGGFGSTAKALDVEEMRSERRGARRIVTLPGDGLSFYGEGSNGRGVLLLHGITGSPVEMKPVAKKLHRAGYAVFAPLLAGHGIDLATLRRTRWKDWYGGALKASDWFTQRCDETFVAGICGGGLLGLRLAHEQPCIRAAAVYSPLLAYDGWNAPLHYRFGHIAVPIALRLGLSRYISVKERHPFGIKSERLRRLLAETDGGMRGTLPAFPVETLHQTFRMYRWIRKNLPHIRTPSLLIHSRIDDLAGPQNAEYIAEHIGGPCEVDWLENSYHMVHVDQESGIVAERTRLFFDRHAK
ncbi:MAG: alpha/beta hydrolase [Hyphomicrobiaceae bacterium]